MADLLKRISKGAAGETTERYLGDLLDQLYRDAANALENARGDDALREARADFKAVRKLLRRLEYDIKDGRVAQRDMDAVPHG